jgi:hypothetical protein
VTLYAVEGVSTQGNETVIYVPTLANPATPDVSSEVGTAVATALNLGYAFRGFSPSAEQGTSEDVRLASVQTFESPGRVKPTIDDVTYVYDPQAPADTADNVHYETLKPGVTGYLIDRRGLGAAVAPAAGQIVDVYPIQCGAQRRVAVDPSAEGGKFEIIQKFFITGTVRYDVALVA